MMESAILTKLTELLRDLLDNEDLVLTSKTAFDEIDGWDSLAQVRLLVGMEAAFSIRFQTQEMDQIKDIGSLIVTIDAKL